jgi:hypothetical protein
MELTPPNLESESSHPPTFSPFLYPVYVSDYNRAASTRYAGLLV